MTYVYSRFKIIFAKTSREVAQSGKATVNARRLSEGLMAERVDPPLNRPLIRAVILFLSNSFDVSMAVIGFPIYKVKKKQRDVVNILLRFRFITGEKYGIKVIKTLIK